MPAESADVYLDVVVMEHPTYRRRRIGRVDSLLDFGSLIGVCFEGGRDLTLTGGLILGEFFEEPHTLFLSSQTVIRLVDVLVAYVLSCSGFPPPYPFGYPIVVSVRQTFVDDRTHRTPFLRGFQRRMFALVGEEHRRERFPAGSAFSPCHHCGSFPGGW